MITCGKSLLALRALRWGLLLFPLLVLALFFAPLPSGQTSNPTAAPLPPPPPPSFTNYPAPNGLGTSAGEPTLGVNWATGNVMFIASLQTLRVSFDDCSSPAKATWADVTAPNTGVLSFDPILFTDSDVSGPNGAPLRTNRTVVSQLIVAGGESLMAFTDDDGATWTPSQGSGINSGVDHQTVGGGPYNNNAVPPPPPHPNYPHAVYYASQDVGVAQIARSDNGGLTFGPAVPMWTLAQCGGIHGHIKVAADGTIYVPNKSCGGAQGVAVSTDNGLTWAIRTVPGSTAVTGIIDPSVGIGSDGTVYFGYVDGNRQPKVAVSQDRGLNWSTPVNVGTTFGLQNTTFPEMVAGDGDRAAFFFLGTTTPGANANNDDQVLPYFTGTWYGYIAVTYDRGQTWTTVNATPNDPVQRGVVCNNGTTCPDGTRNLLDFNDLTIDARGRILASYADGCITDECKQGVDRNGDGAINRLDNDGAALATIIRQSGGKGLLAAYDTVTSMLPSSPLVTATFITPTTVRVTWSTPDNGGSPLTSYKIFRGTSGDLGTLLATVGPEVNFYDDTTVTAGSMPFYRVIATNVNGDGLSCGKVFATTPETPCTEPGISVLVDGIGDQLADIGVGIPQHDIHRVSIAEPLAVGAGKLVFTIKMANLNAPLTASTSWRVLFTDPGNVIRYVDMRTDAAGAVSFMTGTGTATGGASTSAPVDAGTFDAATGVIRIVVATSAIGNPTPGQTLKSIFMRVTVGALVPDNSNYPDPSPDVKYTLQGNNACQTDLAIDKTVAPDPILSGANATYTLTVTNNGPGPANFLTVTDTLPAAATFVSCAATGGGICGGAGNNRVIAFPSLASGASATITLVAAVPCSVAAGTMITNTATVAAASPPDTDLSNNSKTINTTVNNGCQPDQADLVLIKTASSPVVAGANVTFTLTLTNSGPNVAANVVLTDVLPAGTSYVSCSVIGSGVCGGTGNNRTVTFDSLAANSPATITLVAAVGCAVADGTVLSNAASVTTTTLDPNLSNNAATALATVANASAFSAPGECFAYDGGAASVGIVGSTNCPVTSNAPWITVNSVSGGVVNYTVAPNNTYSRRSGMLTVANGITFTVRQGQLFDDVPTSHPFHPFIGKLSARGVTVGCGDGRNYCPDASVTREQMAIFIVRDLGEFNPPNPPTQRFNDVGPERVGYRFVDRLAALGITGGCSTNPPLYCPDDPITREQMAIFVIRALGEFNPPEPAMQRYNDVGPERIGYRFIDRMAVLGITQGCVADPPLYCPDAPTTRGQMAVFLTRAFGCPNPRIP